MVCEKVERERDVCGRVAWERAVWSCLRERELRVTDLYAAELLVKELCHREQRMTGWMGKRHV